MSNTFFQEVEFYGGLALPAPLLGYGPGAKSWLQAPDTLSASAQFVPFACRSRSQNGLLYYWRLLH